MLEMIPQVPDVQAAWLLLVFCASTRANFFLRTVAPEFTLEFAERHDEQVYTLLEKRTPALNFIHLFRLWKGKLHVDVQDGKCKFLEPSFFNTFFLLLLRASVI